MSFNFKNKFSPERINIIGLLFILLLISSAATRVNFWLGVFCFVITFLSVGVSFFILFFHNKKGNDEEIESFTRKFVHDSGDVFAVVDENDRIVWSGGAFEKYFKTGFIISQTLGGITNDNLNFGRLTQHISANGNDPVILEMSDFTLSVTAAVHTFHGKNVLCVTFVDITLLKDAKNLLKKRDLAVAYAMIDNASEAMVYVSERSREASLRISTLLHDWVKTVNGIIREYDRDKYIIFFESGYLDELIKDRFSFMDKINAAPEDAFEINLTLSMGVAYVEGSLEEKEEAAKSALELALQRGGAQTSVKTKEGTYVFGGRVRAVRKQTKIRSRVVANKLVSMIFEASNVLIMGHKQADFDCIASCIGLARLCLNCGSKVNIVVNFNDKDVCAAKEHLNQELYENVFVDSIAGQDLVTGGTLVITSDVSNPTIFECAEIVENAGTFVVIDHHRQAKEFDRKPDLSYIEPTASSASELVCEILEHILPSDKTLKEEADLLYAGILLDTQTFARNTGVRTFGAAIFLNNIGGSLERGKDMLKANASEYKKLASIQSGVSIYRSVFAITIYEDDETDGNNRVIAAKAADNMLEIEGIKASFVLTAVEGGVHISARSDGSINVALILEKLGGGGHFNMAGARLENVGMDNAVLELKDAIEKYDK